MNFESDQKVIYFYFKQKSINLKCKKQIDSDFYLKNNQVHCGEKLIELDFDFDKKIG